MSTPNKDIFTQFEGRKAQLEKITRFSLFPVMLYRTNLWNHARRVAWLVEEINPFAVTAFGNSYDPEKARILALVHDDAEIITGDVQAGNKSKMSPAELADIDEHERQAIIVLAERFPKHVGEYSYAHLLNEALNKDSLEAQVMGLADKLDAFGEDLHEVYAGNLHFVTHVVNEYGVIPIPSDFFIDFMATFTTRYPAMAPLFQNNFWAFSQPIWIDFKIICQKSVPHTAESIKKAVGYPHYDEWRKLIIKRSSPEQVQELLTIKERITF